MPKKHTDKLLDLFLAWQQATQHAQLAANDAHTMEVQFKAVAAHVHGPDATFEWDAVKRRLTFKVAL